MTGWTPALIVAPWLALGGVGIALGLHQFVFPAEYQAEADEQRSFERLSGLSFDSNFELRWWESARAGGLFCVVSAVIGLLFNIEAAEPLDPLFVAGMGGLLTVMGLLGLFTERPAFAWLPRLRRRRTAPQGSRPRPGFGTPPPARPKTRKRFAGIVLLVAGVSSLLLARIIYVS